MLYSLVRPLLFKLEPETAHRVALKSLALSHKMRLSTFSPQAYSNSKQVMGLTFPNAIGLAAGLDKNGEYIDSLASLGFGFIEVGTITPRPQPGNPKPRLFRLAQANALINRMGFNNYGVDYLLAHVKKSNYRGILGINIGKNFDTPVENAAADYVYCLERVYAAASYVVINISSPNTPGLRQLQQADALIDLLTILKNTQLKLATQQQKYVPLVVKISPDLNSNEITDIAQILLAQKIDAVIATNTTMARAGVEKIPHGDEAGGLSGAPLFNKSLQVVHQLSTQLQAKIPIIACGGISTVTAAKSMLAAGASLIQIYTGLIYQGPDVIKQLCTEF